MRRDRKAQKRDLIRSGQLLNSRQERELPHTSSHLTCAYLPQFHAFSSCFLLAPSTSILELSCDHQLSHKTIVTSHADHHRPCISSAKIKSWTKPHSAPPDLVGLNPLDSSGGLYTNHSVTTSGHCSFEQHTCNSFRLPDSFWPLFAEARSPSSLRFCASCTVNFDHHA